MERARSRRCRWRGYDWNEGKERTKKESQLPDLKPLSLGTPGERGAPLPRSTEGAGSRRIRQIGQLENPNA